MFRVVSSLLVILALLSSVGVALAQSDEHLHDDVHAVKDEDTGWVVPLFQDGRLNNADLAAPVVIYYTWEKRPVIDEFGNQVWGDKGGLYFEDIVTGIDVLSIAPETGFVDRALHLNMTEIAYMVEMEGGKDCLLAENAGVSLHYSESGWFWVAAPDREGKLYTFQWDGVEF